MNQKIVKIIAILCGILLLLGGVLCMLARKDVPSHITYGMSFSVPYVLELGLDTKETLNALILDLGVRHFRLAAHWPLIEPREDVYDFELMDYQVRAVEAAEGTIIFGVGRRLPRWPECHVPLWVRDRSWEEQKQEILEYIELVVTRYKGSNAITHWQVENEPYLEIFATEFCGALDESFLEEEIALVKKLDPSRPVLVTDSGNLGTWTNPYRLGDAFGTSVYVYFWNPELGQFKTILPAWFYRVKDKSMALLHGEKETFLIELSLEPWLIEPIVSTPLSTQFARMDAAKFDEIVAYARDTRFSKQYLWGGEWWYWLKAHGNDEMWNKGKALMEE